MVWKKITMPSSFSPLGVIARGVAAKVGPSRSLWSMYRLVKPDEIDVDKVVNIKVTEPVQLTTDPTKAIREVIAIKAAPKRSRIAIEAGAQDMDDSSEEGRRARAALDGVAAGIGADDNKDNTGLNSGSVIKGHFHSNRNIALWSMIHLNMLSSTNDIQDSSGQSASSTTESSQKGIDAVLGAEKYFLNPNSWYGRLSIIGYVQYLKHDSGTTQGRNVENRIFGYALGLNLYPFALPTSVNKVILHAGGSYGIGTARERYEEANEIEATAEDISGSINFFTFGVGAKYYIPGGLGARFLLDYYQRGETYQFEDNSLKTKKVRGPRILVGMAYRW